MTKFKIVLKKYCVSGITMVLQWQEWGDNMTNIISELWYGNIDPSLHLGENNTELKRAEKIFYKNIEKIENTSNDKELIEKIYDSLNEYLSLMCEQAFYNGFCIGTKISAQALEFNEY